MVYNHFRNIVIIDPFTSKQERLHLSVNVRIIYSLTQKLFIVLWNIQEDFYSYIVYYPYVIKPELSFRLI